jgi:hypothetical protein
VLAEAEDEDAAEDVEDDVDEEEALDEPVKRIPAAMAATIITTMTIAVSVRLMALRRFDNRSASDILSR